MTKMLSFLKPYRIAITVALLLMLTELTVELLQPFLISKIIDDGITQQNLSVVMQWGGVLIGCSLLAFLSGIINSFYASHVSQSFGFDVREKLYEKVQSFSFANFNLFPTSSLITRLTNDVTQIQNTVFMSLRIMLRSPLLVVGGVIMSLFIHVKLALLLVVCVPVLLVFLLWAMKKAGRLFRTVQEKLDTVNSVIQENLAGMKLIKAFLRKNHEVKRFTASSRQLKDRTMSVLRFTELTAPIVLLLMNVCIMVILWFGSVEVEAGGASVGQVVAIVNYATRMTAALSMFTMIIMNFSRAKASSSRITEVLDTEGDLVDGTDSEGSARISEGRVVFESVSFRYPETDTPTLHNLSFEVLPGETVAILGATGAGKTSLFQLIPRLYDANEGTISIDHTDIRQMRMERLRQQIGYVPQEALLFTGTVRENIAWGKEDASMEEIVEAAKRAQIHETILKFPNQYNSVIGQKGVNLSGGQRQRLSIARALVRKPKIVLLDDSTSALDAKTEAKLLHALKEYPCTLMMITQKMTTALAADTILLLEDGKLLAKGTHDQLWEHSPLYRRIYHSQFGEETHSHA
ncbi:ABC transporter ATP-binding protein [Paenibacillus sp. J2TS4]|uniref:ABC transporter ATP-binding protein n=1 Tax=Paenibacillus sp. J2TS4 TaxID=2807194 RepID=UPI001B1DD3AD|nr:ABC transporter ATP-binding protein [Paenibacillus sp. J2TS4]GIP31205.1 putative ABC transporter ATP-binding protein YfiB [Paenibacillus sp. J2TS4]